MISRIHKVVVPLTTGWQRPAMISMSSAVSQSILSLFVFVLSTSMTIAAVEGPLGRNLTGTLGYFPPPDSAGGWRTATNATRTREFAGMELRKLEQTWDFTQRCTQNGGLLVVRHGWLAFEKYFGRASRNANPDMASTGKAYASIACGIMLREFRDKIPDGLETKVFTQELLPEAFSADGKLDDERRADITLGQLLCMSGGYTGEGGTPTAVVMGKAFPLKAVPGQNIRDVDMSSLRCAMWTNAGAGYSYSSPEPHIASMVLRRITGMELQDYINERLAKPMGWGAWGYCLHRGDFTLPHANGAGSIAVHATDALRFGYCLLRGGKWNDQQLVPPDYVARCNQMSPHNPHCPLHADVRAQCRRPRGRRATRCLLEIRRGGLRADDRALAGPGDLQNGRAQRAIRSDAYGLAAARAGTLAR